MRKKCAGFTLMEAMIVMAIMAITVIVVPPMLQWFRQQGVGHAVNQLQADLQLARMMAINRQRTCSIQFNRPGNNQYQNLLNGLRSDLSAYRGGVQFLKQGPDGEKMAEQIDFNRQGMSASIIPINIFIADRGRSRIYRLRILLPGGVSRYHWQTDHWQ